MSGLKAVFLSAMLTLGAGIASAGIVDVGPFTGSFGESFESFSTGLITSPFSIMGGEAMLDTPSAFIYNATTAQFGIGLPSVKAQPADGVNGLGLEGGGMTATITFAQSVASFGGYFGSGSFSDGATFNFYDELMNLVGTETIVYQRNGEFGGDGGLDWHGWSFDAPVKTLTYVGDFVVADSLQADLPSLNPEVPIEGVPEPATLGLVGAALAAAVFLKESIRGRARN